VRKRNSFKNKKAHKKMKKTFLLAVLALNLGVSAQAQIVSSASILEGGAYGNAVDTVDNTESITKYVKVQNSNNNISIQVVITKISGTVGGTVIPVASNDGVNFVDISRPSIAATSLRPSYKDTLTPTNQTTNTKIYTFTKATATDAGTSEYGPYLYYGIKYTGTGTMSAKFKAYAVGRK
jgi:hypothetical protein